MRRSGGLSVVWLIALVVALLVMCVGLFLWWSWPRQAKEKQ
jgi:flagellar basal body-associated protein FliL